MLYPVNANIGQYEESRGRPNTYLHVDAALEAEYKTWRFRSRYWDRSATIKIKPSIMKSLRGGAPPDV
jgi:hypothetical protein